MAKDVFISYSRQDSEVADRLSEALEHAGITCFIDREAIFGGERFIDVIAHQIHACKLFLFIGSTYSYDSIWTMKEVSYAFQVKEGKCIFPLLIDNTPLPNNLKFLFADLNVLQLTNADKFENVVDGLLLMLDRRSSSPFNFTEFMEKWQSEPHNSTEDYMLKLFLDCFGSINDFDLYTSNYYKDYLSHITIPYATILPDAPWADNYDWDLLKRLIIASNTDKTVPLCKYSFVLYDSWKLNPQSDVQIAINIDYQNGRYLDLRLHEMKEPEIINLQEVLVKEMIDSMLRMETPEQRGYLIKEMEYAESQFRAQVARIDRNAFYERTKNYDLVDSFHEERAKVHIHNLIGFIEPSGKLITPIRWEDAGNYSEGLACVADSKTGYYGYIDRSGVVKIPFIWDAAHSFIDGKAEVSDDNGNRQVIDRNGVVITD